MQKQKKSKKISCKATSKKPSKISFQKKRVTPSEFVLDLKQQNEEKVNKENSKQSIKETINQELLSNFSFKKPKQLKRILSGPKPPKVKHADNFLIKERADKVFNNSKQQKPKKIKKQQTNFYLPKIKIKNLKLVNKISAAKNNLTTKLKKYLKLPELNLKPTKQILAFIFICLLLFIPLKSYSYYLELKNKKGEILGIAKTGLDHVKMAALTTKAADIESTQTELEKAEISFQEAISNLEEINTFIKNINRVVTFSPQYYNTSKSLLQASQLLTASSLELVSAINDIEKEDSQLNQLSLIQKLFKLQETFNSVRPKLTQAEINLNNIDINLIPEEYKLQLKELTIMLPLVNNSLNNFISQDSQIFNLLAKDGEKRYLVLFQNNHELRATGGFIGSYALIDIKDGEIVNLDIPQRGSYDLRAGLSKYIISPEPLKLVNARWEFHDANWFFDFPTSAKKLDWFLQESQGPSVDGVIAINAEFMENLLKILGEIESNGTYINADNFFLATQKTVEYDYNKIENNPKQIISELGPKIINQLFQSSAEDLLNISNLILQSLQAKDIQIYFNDPSLESWAIKNNWAGEIKNTSKDYLAVVNTNIHGGKSDQVMSDQIKLETILDKNGELINNLTIYRTHNGDINNPLTKDMNYNYLRVYTPLGSQIISCSGFRPPDENSFKEPEEYFKNDQDLNLIEAYKTISTECQNTEIYEENGKTVFANWVLTDIGQTTVINISYKLPFTLRIPNNNTPYFIEKLKELISIDENYLYYTLIFQKQSGTTPSFEHSFINEDSVTPIWIYPEGINITANQYSKKLKISKDYFEAFIFKISK